MYNLKETEQTLTLDVFDKKQLYREEQEFRGERCVAPAPPPPPPHTHTHTPLPSPQKGNDYFRSKK